MMRPMRALTLVVLLLGVSSCSKKPKPDIPVYPDAMGMQSKGTMQNATMFLFNNKWHTLASMGEVRGFYEKSLLARPGWKMEDARDRVVFTDENLRQVGELFELIDPARSGGYVELLNASDQRTLIDIWQGFPAPKR